MMRLVGWRSCFEMRSRMCMGESSVSEVSMECMCKVVG